MKTLYTAINDERTWQDFLRRDKTALAGGMIFPGRNPFLIQTELDSVNIYEKKESALHVARLRGWGHAGMAALRMDIPDDCFDQLVADNLIVKVGDGVWKVKTIAFFDSRLTNATARVEDSD